jgi:hypothetical protein
MIPDHNHFQIGSLIFEDIDQIDVTGHFEVFSRLPNSTYRLWCSDPLMDEGYLEGPSASEFDHLRSSSGSQQLPVTDLEELMVLSAPWVDATLF